MNVHVFVHHYGRHRPVGLLTRGERGVLFEYHPDFLGSGIQLSPFMLPLRPGIFFDEKQTFDGLYGLFNDSLPDGWGLLLLDRSLKRQGRSPGDISVLERLTRVGRNGMGALEYEPDASSAHTEMLADLDRLAEESARILGEQEYAGEHLDEFFTLSGSLAGARPKVCLMLPDDTGTPCPWIVKFPPDRIHLTLADRSICTARRPVWQALMFLKPVFSLQAEVQATSPAGALTERTASRCIRIQPAAFCMHPIAIQAWTTKIFSDSPCI